MRLGQRPPHYNLFSGLLPHSSPKHVFASEYYKSDFLKYSERLEIEGISFKSLIPKLYFPAFLQKSLGYRTHAMVSLPVLNPATILNHGFDTYQLMDRHNDMRAMVRQMRFPEDRPSFYLLNVGETHYPYALPDEKPRTGRASVASTASSSIWTTNWWVANWSTVKINFSMTPSSKCCDSARSMRFATWMV